MNRTKHTPATSGITTNEQGHFSLCRFTAEIKARRCTETATGTWYTEKKIKMCRNCNAKLLQLHNYVLTSKTYSFSML
jgi:hypothetical protein